MAAALYASPNDNLVEIKTNDFNTKLVDPWPWYDLFDGPRGGKITVRAWDKRKKHNRMKRLQISGALILAEMERLQRIDSAASE